MPAAAILELRTLKRFESLNAQEIEDKQGFILKNWPNRLFEKLTLRGRRAIKVNFSNRFYKEYESYQKLKR
jgi:hypothetical protein